MAKNRAIQFFGQGVLKKCGEWSNSSKYEILAKTNGAFRENGEKESKNPILETKC